MTKTDIETKWEILNKNGSAQTLNNENVCEYMYLEGRLVGFLTP